MQGKLFVDIPSRPSGQQQLFPFNVPKYVYVIFRLLSYPRGAQSDFPPVAQ